MISCMTLPVIRWFSFWDTDLNKNKQFNSLTKKI
jgi:hypothetical protein